MPSRGLSFQCVSHAFGDLRVVDELSLEVTPGEIVCLLGPSGCGKTTALRIAAGLERLQQGRVALGDRVLAEPGNEVPPEARGVGMVFQEYALFPHLSVLENVAFGLARHAGGERRRIATAMLERVKMAAFAEAYPHTLSGGEQQRVALARALAPQPAVLLLDEPFANLDVRLRDAIRHDTLSLLREAGTVSLMVTHDPDEAMRMADRIAVMRRGGIEQIGTPDEVYHRPANRFIAEFFCETNVLETVVSGGMAETPAGSVAAPGLGEGAEVAVLARPEALCLNGSADGVRATVLEARSLGPFALVALTLGQDGPNLLARLASVPLPAPGSVVQVRLDPAQTFVFPRNER